MRKNEAGQHVGFNAYSTTDGTPVSTGSPSVLITIDGGTQSTGGGTITSEGNGQWVYAPTQAETNGSHIIYSMSLTGAMSAPVNTYPKNIEDIVWDEPVANHTTASTTGKKLDVSGVLASASDIAALNNLSAADVNAEVDTAISDAALATAASIAALNDVSQLEVLACVNDIFQVYGAVSGGTSTTVVTGDNRFIGNDDHYVGSYVQVFDGSTIGGNSNPSASRAFGQTRLITGYNSSTKTLTVSPAWDTTPSTGGSEWIRIIPAGYLAGVAGTIQTLDALDTAQDAQHAQTQADIGGLNDLNSTAVQSAVTAALQALHLDHLVYGTYTIDDMFSTSAVQMNPVDDEAAGMAGSILMNLSKDQSVARIVSYELNPVPYWQLDGAPETAAGWTAGDTLILIRDEFQQSTGTIKTLDALDAAQDTQHAATQAAIPSTSDITTAILGMTTESGLTFKQFTQAVFAAAAGKASGLESTTATFRNAADDTDRIVATVDTDGNRTAITFTFEA